MSPFQERHQPTHAGQPAGALDFALDEEPIASVFDGEGPPFDSAFFDAWMEAPGIWNHEIAPQGAIDPGQAIILPFNAEEEPFDHVSNYWTDDTLEFSAGFSSQRTFGQALNQQVTMPPFHSTLWMDQPLGLLDTEIASQSALFNNGQAPIAQNGAQSHLQDASFDCFHPLGWTGDDTGMPDALGALADPIG